MGMPVILSARHALLEPQPLGAIGWPGASAWRVGNRVGESPVWNAAAQTLLWIDVRAPELLRLHPASGALTRWTLPDVVGALGLIDADTVVLAQRRSLATLQLSSGLWRPWRTVEAEPAGNRLNDGKVSPSGRWWVFGSMDDAAEGKQPRGALYCAGGDGRPRRLHGGLTVANGIAFSVDGSLLYFSDSHAGQVFVAPWNEADGSIGQARLLCSSAEADGRPDGALVDAGGHYWSAGVSAGCLNRFAADGRLAASLPLPCRWPTMPCFGGARLEWLFVTSLQRAGTAPGGHGLDGALLQLPAPAPACAAALWHAARAGADSPAGRG